MTKVASLFVAVSLATTASFAASAQDSVGATLRVDRGRVMTSHGGEFATAQSRGQVVAAGNRLLIAENSAATLIFSDGCQRPYTTPGVYTIERICTPGDAVAGGASSFDAAGAATVAAFRVGMATILHDMEQSDDVPLPVGR